MFDNERFIKVGTADNQLGILNIMRSSIQATTLLDIFTAEGRYIMIQEWTLMTSNKLQNFFD